MNTNLEGKTIGGRYLIVKKLGGGTFGTTYIAEDRQLPDRTRCVVKQFTPQYSEPSQLQTARRLFDQEAKALNKLGKHELIPQLLAYFEEERQFFLVQELIEGHDLSQELERGLHLSESYAIALLRKVLEPLKFVHEQGYIHRDLKPSNLIRRKSNGQIVLIDFGAVKERINPQNITSGGQFSPTVAVGTLGYMPCEQINNCPDFCSDIYALGAIAIQALTGVAPFLLPKDRNGEIVWRDRLQAGVVYNQTFLNILDRMVRYHFKERYQSAIEVSQALNNLKSTLISDRKPLIKWWKLVGGLGTAAVSTFIIFKMLAGAETENFLTYENQIYGIKIDYPEDWDRQDRDDIYNKGAVFLSPLEDNSDRFREQISILIENLSTQPLSLLEYTDESIKQIKNNSDVNVSSPNQETLAHEPGYSVVYQGKYNGYDVQHMQIWTVRNNQAYVITYTAEPEKYNKFLELAKKMIKSFEIEK